MKIGRRSRIGLVRSFLCLAVFAACFVSCRNDGSGHDFSYKLKKIDSYIVSGEKKRAVKNLRSLRALAGSSGQWLSIAKRERNLDCYEDAAVTLKAALKALPANESITAVLTDTLTKLGLYTEACTVSKSLVKTPYAPLAAYAEIQRTLLQGNSTPDASWWELAWAGSGNEAFRRNAAVLYAGNGNFAAACSLYRDDAGLSGGTELSPQEGLPGAEETKPVAEDAFFRALLCYDGGFYDLVSEILPSIDDERLTPEMITVLADTACKKHDMGLARSLWEVAVERDPVRSPVPYYDLAVTAESAVSARDSLETCLSFFPSWYPAVVRYVRSVPDAAPARQNDPVTSVLEQAGFMTLEMEEQKRNAPVDAQKAEKILSIALAKEAPSPDVRFRIEALRFARLRDSDVERSVAGIWKLLETYKNNPVLQDYAVWYLALTDNYEDSFALNRSKSSGEDPFFSGMEAAYSGDLDKALEKFALEANSEQNAWAALANTACIYAKRQDWDKASETIASAADIAPDDRMRSRLHYKAAVYLQSMNSPERMRNELGYALDLDPLNRRAAMLLRALDAKKSGRAVTSFRRIF